LEEMNVSRHASEFTKAGMGVGRRRGVRETEGEGKEGGTRAGLVRVSDPIMEGTYLEGWWGGWRGTSNTNPPRTVAINDQHSLYQGNRRKREKK